ncbi:GspE/PulE family protein, partial [bacterium]|nr:GspE/PulE family protein [bacterium]
MNLQSLQITQLPVPESFSFPGDGEWKKLTPTNLLLEFGAVVLGKKDNQTVIGAQNPALPELKQFLKQHYPGSITIHQISKKEQFDAIRSGVVDFRKEIEDLLVSDLGEDTRIPRLVTLLIHFAIREKVSDIHIESGRHESHVRFRLDGVLHEVATLPATMHTPVVARIKILANLKTDETRRPQDGRFEAEGCDDISLRVSVMPTLYGEKVVMRILNESNGVPSLDELGFSEEQKEIITRNMGKPYGMILASGPTGSGKTTTLYSLVRLLNVNDINIATLEDPIESGLEGVNQTQVNPDLHFSFANGLRALLRQDPDVILVGEIRDEETINMAAHASMTGHLVLTSLHTNDAASAFSRFMEMGVDNFMASSVVNLVIAQRLVRGLCPHCAKEAKLDPIIIKKIKDRKDLCT